MLRRVIILLIVFCTSGVLAYVALLDVSAEQSAKTIAVAQPVASNLAAVKSYLRTIAGDTSSDENDDDADEDAWPPDADSPEQVMYAQAAMVRRAIDGLTPARADSVNLYLVGFAGDGEENVFRNEVEYVAKLFDQRFAGSGHSLILANNPQTLTRYPLATLSNLELAANAIAGKMDRDRDILMVFLTSHGSPDHLLYVSMDPLPLDQIAPEDLAAILAATHVRYKVVILSACYSGGFIDAIKSPTTLVITAARKDRSSFGCCTDSPITYFGRAFFFFFFNRTDSLTKAFSIATGLIDQWETADKEKHSYPQIASAPQIEAQLAKWRHDIRLGPAVAFDADTKTKTSALPANKQ